MGHKAVVVKAIVAIPCEDFQKITECNNSMREVLQRLMQPRKIIGQSI